MAGKYVFIGGSSTDDITYLPPFTGGVSESLSSKLSEIVSVRDFGAVGDGAANDTTAIAAAVSAAADNGCVFFPPGQYKITTRIDAPYTRHRWIGSGRGSTRIVFAPAADGVAIRFGSASALTNQSSIEHMTITSGDSTYAKTAIQLYDTSAFVIRDVEITGTVTAGGTLAWTGGTGGSVGIRTQGREAPRFEGGCYVSADNPFRVSANIRVTSPQIDADFFALNDLYMVAYGYPNVLIDGDVELINFKMTGCPMVRGTNGVKWIGTSATRATAQFVIRDCRIEQPEDSSAYAIDLQPNQNVYGLQIDGLQLPPLVNGIRLRKCIGPTLQNVICNQNTAKVVIDVDSTVTHMRHDSCYWGTTTTATMTNQRTIWAANKTASNEPLPRNALYDVDSNTAQDLTFDGGLRGRVVSMADSTATYLGPAGMVGYLDIIRGDGATATFRLKGGFNSTQEVNDIDAIFSTTAGTASSGNCYYDGAGASGAGYYFQNKFGSTYSFGFVLRGATINF